MGISSYPTVYALGHRVIEDIFKSSVVIQEKIDGSQFSFGIMDGELEFKSKGAIINKEHPEKMFSAAVTAVIEMEKSLRPGYTYRAEYLEKPHHNTLTYSRIPIKHIILFDVAIGGERYLDAWEMTKEAERLGLEAVPILHVGMIKSASELEDYLKSESILGGTQIEGVVVKNYQLITDTEKKIAIGKYVREDFKEMNTKNWRKMNPTQGDILVSLIDKYKTEARWRKAIQHLKEKGELEGEPRDIGKLIPEIKADVLKEEKDQIKEELFEYFWPKIERGIIGGFPEFYKKLLLEKAFK